MGILADGFTNGKRPRRCWLAGDEEVNNEMINEVGDGLSAKLSGLSSLCTLLIFVT